ncbi:MAG: NAD-dependent epimerase/dehydratase family protein [Pseudomonadota bacterium]
MRIALLGGGGFIGSNLALHLSTLSQFEVTVYDRDAAKLQQRFADSSACRFVSCDVREDAPALASAVSDADLVVNLIAHVLPKQFIGTPLEVVELNLHDNLRVLEACVRFQKRILHFSTCEVYGKTGGSSEPFREDLSDCVLGPISNHRWIYSSAKQMMDRIIHAHGLNGDLDYTIVRPFNFVGPLMDWIGPSEHAVPRVFASFMNALLEKKSLPLVNGGSSRRCFTYIGDAVRAIATIIQNPEQTRNQIINIGNPGNETSIAELAALMRRLFEQQTGETAASDDQYVSGDEFYGKGYEDCDRRVPDISKLHTLGWHPEFDLEQTFAATMAYCRKNHAALLALPR